MSLGPNANPYLGIGRYVRLIDSPQLIWLNRTNLTRIVDRNFGESLDEGERTRISPSGQEQRLQDRNSGNGQLLPDGSMLVKFEWKPKKSSEAPFVVVRGDVTV